MVMFLGHYFFNGIFPLDVFSGSLLQIKTIKDGSVIDGDEERKWKTWC